MLYHVEEEKMLKEIKRQIERDEEEEAKAQRGHLTPGVGGNMQSFLPDDCQLTTQ